MTITDPQLDRLVRKAAKPATGLAGKPAAAIRPDRDQVKASAMYRPRSRKFALNRAPLRPATGDAEIAGAAPGDYSRGIGRQARGENEAGRIMERIRTEPRASASGER